jgi:hypothetical protein
VSDDDDCCCDCGDPECPECGGGDCWYCHGEGYGIVGEDWPANELDTPGKVQKCPNCGGSGEGKDCWFW